jgi:hypothetical protein
MKAFSSLIFTVHKPELSIQCLLCLRWFACDFIRCFACNFISFYHIKFVFNSGNSFNSFKNYIF